MYRDIQFEKIAKEAGFSYAYNDEFGLIKLLRDFKLFRRFDANKITNILGVKTALNESSFRIFDFQYRTWDGEQEKISIQTVFFAQSKQLTLPHFYMEPGHSFKQVGNHSGIENIDFDAFPLFSVDYWLKKEARKQTQNIIPEDLLHYFATEKDWCIEGLNYFMIIYKKEKIIPTTDLLSFYEKGKQIVSIFSTPT